MSEHKTRRQFPAAPRHPRAVVLRAHPCRDSFNSALVDAWIEGARSHGVLVEAFDLAALSFQPLLTQAYRADQPLEPDLQRVRDAIGEGAHLVIGSPVWWGSTPALLKGFIDRVFLPGWAYAYNGSARPLQGLAGRSARVLLTMDGPTWWDRLMYGRSARRQLKDATLAFVGYRPVSMSVFPSIGSTTPAQRQAMLDRARRDGARDGAALLRRFTADRRPRLLAAK